MACNPCIPQFPCVPCEKNDVSLLLKDFIQWSISKYFFQPFLSFSVRTEMLHSSRPFLNATMSWNLSTTKMWATIRQNSTATKGSLPKEGGVHKPDCNWQARSSRTKIYLRAKTNLPTKGNLWACPDLQEARRPWTQDSLRQKMCSRPEGCLPTTMHRWAERNLSDDRVPTKSADHSDSRTSWILLCTDRYIIHKPTRLSTHSLFTIRKTMQSMPTKAIQLLKLNYKWSLTQV